MSFDLWQTLPYMYVNYDLSFIMSIMEMGNAKETVIF